jgi:hypothetical protein
MYYLIPICKYSVNGITKPGSLIKKLALNLIQLIILQNIKKELNVEEMLFRPILYGLRVSLIVNH